MEVQMKKNVSDVKNTSDSHEYNIYCVPETGFYINVVKRIFDIVFSVVCLIILSPVMLVTAICIKLTDGGRIIYYQDRLTLNGKVFRCYKFRSMSEDAEKDGIARLSVYNDPRVTPVGKILRRFHIDEFPQLINVIKGEMSVVGPRPERPELAAQIEETLPQFRQRLSVKAGITGYAQVMGRYTTLPSEKLRMDMLYIEDISLSLDIRIIILTVVQLFKK